MKKNKPQTRIQPLAKQLCQVSPYADGIEPLIDLIPEIMERNDQLPYAFIERDHSEQLNV